MTVHRIEVGRRSDLVDALGVNTQQRLSRWLGLDARVSTRRVYLLNLGLTDAQAAEVAAAITDPIAEHGAVGMLADPAGAQFCVQVGFLPGVTDTVGATVKTAAADALGAAVSGSCHAATLYFIDGLSREDVELATRQALHNPLIERASVIDLRSGARALDLSLPLSGTAAPAVVESVGMRGESDAALVERSNKGMLALNLAEMRAIAAFFEEQGRDPTDAELECLAQTWSEHCKHKIFASAIDYTGPEGERRTVDGLFKQFIRGATLAVEQQRDEDGIDGDKPFLVSVFHDNAGVVRFTERDHLVYKVETHNSPSALDPYGGAMTGIVGVNRDSFGTGLGADLLTNVWGYCLGDPHTTDEIPPGLMHPRRIREGVHGGVIAGGNESGIPYSRGFELFDERFVGKPLVFCGTVAAMPVERAGRPTHEKRTAVGDHVVMLGGRIGKDGIHGATFSSVELDESSPVQAVQIGDPITQKMMFDMLAEAADLGLFSGMTDNGAGGLSSSIGEMAEKTGGARIDLSKAPLKYPGLQPWEVLISEAQERMSLAVPPEHLDAFMALAKRREVEATVLGTFTDTGLFEVNWGDERVAALPLEFLHDGLPKTTLKAVWSPPVREVASADAQARARAREALLPALESMMRRVNLASGEAKARGYDHEVKGLSVVKPWVGAHADVPATGTVMRVRHGRDEGVVLGEGVHPHYSDLDTRAMALACVDEGVRRVLAAGARFDRIAALDNFCWPDPIESDKTPDGAHKLAQLVRCCEGLYDACVAYGVPLISGKDSMKNDANLGGKKISIPPTLLVSVIGQTPDVARVLTLQPQAVGDRVLVLGTTRDELGASEWSRDQGLWLDTVPQTDLMAYRARYAAFTQARDAGLVESAHVLGRGGLAAAVTHTALSCDDGVGLRVDVSKLAMLDQVDAAAALFSESTGRLLLTASPDALPALRELLDPHGLIEIGEVVQGDEVSWHDAHGALGVTTKQRLRALSQEGLNGV